MPEGVFLPNVPSPQVTPSLPTAPLALQDIAGREAERKHAAHLTRDRAPPPTLDEKRKTDEALGQVSVS
jgi:hypothetical protein